MNKRTFFKSLASIVATVALAPEIAFGTKLALPKINPLWLNAEWEVLFIHAWDLHYHSHILEPYE